MADEYLIENDKVSYRMHEGHQEKQDDKSEKGDIVLGPYTGVQPSTVVVEAIYTAVADSTVF